MDLLNRKREQLSELLRDDFLDLPALRVLSRSPGGFLDSTFRSRIWPAFLDVDLNSTSNFQLYVEECRDCNQVRRDIERSLWSLKQAANWSDKRLDARRQALNAIIEAVLISHEELFYYQGFHDVVSGVMLALGESSFSQPTGITVSA
jgi:hypothetical protein